MTGIAIEVDINDTELGKFLRDKLGQMQNLRPFYVNVGEHMLNSVQDRFDTETAPDGSSWAALSPVTSARRGGGELAILRDSGRLAGSFNYAPSSTQVSIGTPVVYAAMQHFGGQAGRNKSITIPPRPILGVSTQDEDAIKEMAEC